MSASATSASANDGQTARQTRLPTHSGAPIFNYPWNGMISISTDETRASAEPATASPPSRTSPASPHMFGARLRALQRQSAAVCIQRHVRGTAARRRACDRRAAAAAGTATVGWVLHRFWQAGQKGQHQGLALLLNAGHPAGVVSQQALGLQQGIGAQQGLGLSEQYLGHMPCEHRVANLETTDDPMSEAEIERVVPANAGESPHGPHGPHSPAGGTWAASRSGDAAAHAHGTSPPARCQRSESPDMPDRQRPCSTQRSYMLQSLRCAPFYTSLLRYSHIFWTMDVRIYSEGMINGLSALTGTIKRKIALECFSPGCTAACARKDTRSLLDLFREQLFPTIAASKIN